MRRFSFTSRGMAEDTEGLWVNIADPALQATQPPLTELCCDLEKVRAELRVARNRETIDRAIAALTRQQGEPHTDVPGVPHPDADLSKYDAGQHRLNGGPYCYHVKEDGRYCGAAQRWPGHPVHHEFVPVPATDAGKGA